MAKTKEDVYEPKSTLFGDVAVTHYCKKCETHKDITEFRSRHRGLGVGWVPYNICISCTDDADSTREEARKVAPPLPKNHVCPTCNRTGDKIGYSEPFALDHCHKTGEGRGWVCQDCNTAIARIHDDPQVALNIAAYLIDTDREKYFGGPRDSVLDI